MVSICSRQWSRFYGESLIYQTLLVGPGIFVKWWSFEVPLMMGQKKLLKKTIQQQLWWIYKYCLPEWSATPVVLDPLDSFQSGWNKNNPSSVFQWLVLLKAIAFYYFQVATRSCCSCIIHRTFLKHFTAWLSYGRVSLLIKVIPQQTGCFLGASVQLVENIRCDFNSNHQIKGN